MGELKFLIDLKVIQIKVWVKHSDPNNKYGAKFTLGERDIQLPDTAIISVTRGERFNIFRIIINGIVNEIVKKQLVKNNDLLYAELSGQIQGGIGQTVTVWKDINSMNNFRTKGAHSFAKKFFAWVFYSGEVQAYFLTWRISKQIPTNTEIEETVKKHGRFFDGGRLVRQAQQPRKNTKLNNEKNK
ncbi:hypothetical protein QJQ58_09435 [Paenibacillus dendritiformis]|uniref:hypothetical protein n=1 Tax=Paenibacillus dendritiformis TaxID=130049 RepID=UPI00248B2356|nr:hypothetical protein [Paenibacillus dendritiformis]WGU96432.1 hypothetical protein QJQ58_09435 [Paenibacillus dendritiformis]